MIKSKEARKRARKQQKASRAVNKRVIDRKKSHKR